MFKKLVLLMGFGFFFNAASLLAVVNDLEKKANIPFTVDLQTLKPSLNISTIDKEESLSMPVKKIVQRVKKSATEEIVEPLIIKVWSKPELLRAFVARLANRGKSEELLNYLENQLKNLKKEEKDSDQPKVQITEEALDYIDLTVLGKIFEKPHHSVFVNTELFSENKNLRRRFLSQVDPYFSTADRQKIRKKILTGMPLKVDYDLLPHFARDMVKKFTIYKGPNCFHAALAFQSPQLTSSSLVNVKIEEGYHRSMINYDELWRVLQTSFYEIDPAKVSMKYGDIMVFFELPDKIPADVDFHWIVHTSTYLFNNFAFSKGSKSPNTPYTVKTLQEEWQTWKGFTKKLGVKVFRRSSREMQKAPSASLSDWLY